jgi:hypothetical protein
MAKTSTTMKEPRFADLRLALELRTPVAEPLQRQSMQLAILPLAQPAPHPFVMMKPPETLQLRMLLPA